MPIKPIVELLKDDLDIPPSVRAPVEEAPSASSPRSFQLYLPSRLFTARTNASLWLSSVNGLGFLNEKAGDALSLNESLLGRSALVLTSVYENWVATYYSHELGHYEVYPTIDCSKASDLRLDLSDWSHLAPSLQAYPKISNELSIQCQNIRLIAQSVALAPSQQQLNGQTLFLEDTRNDAMPYDHGIAYLANKLSLLIYALYAQLNPRDTLDTTELMYFSHLFNVPFSKQDWLLMNFFSFVGTYRSWESMAGIGGYLMDGKINRNLNFFEIERMKIYPPDFTTYVSVEGPFVNMTLPVWVPFSNQGAFLILEEGASFEGQSSFRTMLHLDQWPVFGASSFLPKVSLSGAITAYRGELNPPSRFADEFPDHDLGVLGQIGLTFSTPFHIGLFGGYSNDDALENNILAQPGGYELHVVLTY